MCVCVYIYIYIYIYSQSQSNVDVYGMGNMESKVFIFISLWHGGKMEDFYKCRTTCLFICLFLDLIAVLHNLKNNEAFVSGKTQRTSTSDFRFAVALKIVSPFSDIWLLFAHSQLRLFSACSSARAETQGARMNIHKHTQIRSLP